MKQITQARYNQKLLPHSGMMDNTTQGFLGALIKLNITIIFSVQISNSLGAFTFSWQKRMSISIRSRGIENRRTKTHGNTHTCLEGKIYKLHCLMDYLFWGNLFFH